MIFVCLLPGTQFFSLSFWRWRFLFQLTFMFNCSHATLFLFLIKTFCSCDMGINTTAPQSVLPLVHYFYKVEWLLLKELWSTFKIFDKVQKKVFILCTLISFLFLCSFLSWGICFKILDIRSKHMILDETSKLKAVTASLWSEHVQTWEIKLMINNYTYSTVLVLCNELQFQTTSTGANVLKKKKTVVEDIMTNMTNIIHLWKKVHHIHKSRFLH